MQSVLVTGGAGYIGSHICKRLKEIGYLPVTLDDLSTGNEWAVKFGPLVRGSIGDRGLLEETRRVYEPIGVIHAAARSDAAESVREPELYRRINVGGTVALQSALADLPFVFSSSAAVYGSADGSCTEDRTPAPVNPYGQSKLDCECLLFSNVMKLRYFNVAGADGEIGEAHRPETHIVPRVLMAAKTGAAFVIQGDGFSQRDFVDVRDVVEANLLALRTLLAGARGQTLNICGGYEHSIIDVIRIAAKVTKQKIKVVHAPRRPGDPEKLVGRHERATEVLGWRPFFTLEEQVSSAWQWMNRVDR